MKEIMLLETDRIVSKTDRKGTITYINKRFMEICGYSKDELIGQPHNIIRHEDMPKAAFKYVWSELDADREVFAFVKNKTKNGDFYWVLANILPTDEDTLTSFRVKPNTAAVTVMKNIYRQMKDIERREGVGASEVFLANLLLENKVTYSELISNLQTRGAIK